MARYTRRTVAIVAVAAVGFAACGTGTEDRSRQPVDPPSAPGAMSGRGELGPTGARHGVPVGWPAGSGGARAAAVSAVGLAGEIAKAGFITRGDMIDTLASRGFASDLAIATEHQLADLAEALGEIEVLPPAIAWTEVPLTARVVNDSQGTARVEVWSVVVVASAYVGVPRQAWRTVILDMVWEDDDWKVDAWDITPGPTPALAAAAAVSDGREVADVADWPAATGTGPTAAGGGD
jgi:hypothetical protein